MMLVQHSKAVWFPFAVLSTAKGKLIHSANFASRAKRAVINILSLTRIAKLGLSRTAGRCKGVALSKIKKGKEVNLTGSTITSIRDLYKT